MLVVGRRGHLAVGAVAGIVVLVVVFLIVPLTIKSFPPNFYYLEHMFVGKHYGSYLGLKQKIYIKISEILKLHRISEPMPPTAFF